MRGEGEERKGRGRGGRKCKFSIIGSRLIPDSFPCICLHHSKYLGEIAFESSSALCVAKGIYHMLRYRIKGL